MNDVPAQPLQHFSDKPQLVNDVSVELLLTNTTLNLLSNAKPVEVFVQPCQGQ